MSEYLFTSESVTEGHPDKVCDKISDAILDDILESDPRARVACEVAANTGLILVFGEISTEHYCDVPHIVRQTLAELGYTYCYGFKADSCAVLCSIDEQSPDIAQGVDRAGEMDENGDPASQVGAGDQGMMFGYASTESELLEPGTFMPLPIQLAHALARRLTAVRKDGTLPYLRADGKTQVTVQYRDGRPQAVRTVLISSQHAEEAQRQVMIEDLRQHVLSAVLPTELCPQGRLAEVEFLVNPTGRFVRGGPEADSGLTGRKIIVDTYGGMARHGGGAFSGKDPTKVDRCASYYARYAAKNLVAAGAAERLELQVSYAIGRARPLSLFVQTFGSGKVDEQRILALLESGELFDFRPRSIIESLNLLRTRYAPVAAYGHFGRGDLDLPWERLDKVDGVRQALGLG